MQDKLQNEEIKDGERKRMVVSRLSGCNKHEIINVFFNTSTIRSFFLNSPSIQD